ncbi:MAG: translation initiation factor IF-3 [Oscillospiraceae bacterium]|nr:translation initiation factor IF-3 [Oscillospiraceae bacterium]
MCCARIRFCIRVFVRKNKQGGALAIANTTHPLNENIREPQVRLIGEDGEQLGIMSSKEALEIAQERDLDLVMISPVAKPPVCKVMDYGKYRFEQAKREKEAKKNQHVIEVKEIRMSPSIGENDFMTKLRSGQRFLAEGNRLKVTVRFRGREMAHTDLGKQLLERYAKECADIAKVDKGAKLEGRLMTEFLSPKAQTPAKKQTPKQEKSKENDNDAET